jgi:hypothetical protein
MADLTGLLVHSIYALRPIRERETMRNVQLAILVLLTTGACSAADPPVGVALASPDADADDVQDVAQVDAEADDVQDVAQVDADADDVQDVAQVDAEAATDTVEVVDVGAAPDAVNDTKDAAISVQPDAAADIGQDASPVGLVACPAGATPASLPGEATASAPCWSWLRVGKSAEYERKDGNIAVYSPPPVPAGDLQTRYVYGPYGATLTVDEAAPTAEYLAPLGKGYWTHVGTQVQHISADGAVSPPVDTPTEIPNYSGPGPIACKSFRVWVDSIVASPAGNFVAFGETWFAGTGLDYLLQCITDIHHCGHVVYSADGSLVENAPMENEEYFDSSYFRKPFRLTDGVALVALASNFVHIQILQDGSTETNDSLDSFLRDVRSVDHWADGDVLTCAGTDPAYWAGAPDPVNRLVRLGSPAWSLDLACSIAAIRPDGSIVGYGVIDGKNTWFQLNADGTGLAKLAWPAKYVPTHLHASVGSGMFMSGYIDDGGSNATPWMGRSPLKGCQPLACTGY